MTKEYIFDLCTISITHKNKTYTFLKPKDFQCKLLEVRLSKYNIIIAHVINKYDSSIAICYSTDGFVYDGRDGFEQYALTPVTFESFFNQLKEII